ncbi:DUF305 domain-containing protein [Aeromicrobium sp.]|uniref:DUF305 domain-containing protein n=1 Tax=Aeromicrobium sp. TaxID=1871063 RepID=UPI003C3C593A
MTSQHASAHDPEGTPPRDHHEQGNNSDKGVYLRFGAMIVVSTLVMYALTYTNLFAIQHAQWSEERGYMAILMGSAMTVVMLSFMWGRMYPNTRVNVAILGAALAVGGTAFWLSQSQVLVGDQAYMKAMIPHHSIAILTSDRADFDDVRVRELADGISQTQVKEIKEMEWLLDDIDKNGKVTTSQAADQRAVPDFSAAKAQRLPAFWRWFVLSD